MDRNEVLIELRRALRKASDHFATVIHDFDDEDILFTFVDDATDYILTIKEAND